MIIRRNLEHRGIAVSEARTAAEALDALDEGDCPTCCSSTSTCPTVRAGTSSAPSTPNGRMPRTIVVSAVRIPPEKLREFARRRLPAEALPDRGARPHLLRRDRRVMDVELGGLGHSRRPAARLPARRPAHAGTLRMIPTRGGHRPTGMPTAARPPCARGGGSASSLPSASRPRRRSPSAVRPARRGAACRPDRRRLRRWGLPSSWAANASHLAESVEPMDDVLILLVILLAAF